MADRIGQQLGNYRLTRLLGQGGFAEVYLGQHVHLASKQAAIKLLHLLDVDAHKFRKEAETTEKLVHPHIVRLLDFDIEQGTPFLVLDYAPGGSLRSRHPQGSILPLTQVGAYLKELVPALQYAHDLHIFHRDIKPDNILIGRQGELLLSDFGIAVLTQTGRTSLSSAYGIGGTPYYMAPETYQGKPVKASDQYALAIMVYEWLCGSVPFTEGNFIQLGYQHTYNPVPPLREKNPAISPDVETVVLKALAKEPKERFGSVQLFAQALEQASIRTFPTEKPQQGKGQSSQQSVVQTPHSVQKETGGIGKAPPRYVPPEVMPVGKTEPPLERPVVTPPNQSAMSTEAATSPGQGLLPTEPVTHPSQPLWSVIGDVSPFSVKEVPAKDPLSPEAEQAIEGKRNTLPNQALLPTELVAPPRSLLEPTIPASSPSPAPVLSPSRWGEIATEPAAVPEPFKRHLSRRAVIVGLAGLAVASVAGGGLLWLTHSQQPAAPTVSSTSSLSIGKILYTYRATTPVMAVAWSPDSKRIASGSDDKTVQVWNAADGGNVYTYRGHSHGVNRVAWSPDGKRLASAGGHPDDTVQVWDAADGSNVYTYRGHSGPVWSVAWSPDSKRIASGSWWDNLVQVWDAADGSHMYTYRGHSGYVNAVAWSPDGKRIASGAYDETVQVWQAV